MNDLRILLTSLGFEQVTTYIQSGNIVFETENKDPAELGGKIKQQIDSTFGYDVPVIIRTIPEISDALQHFPFDERDGWRGYISFLPEHPSADRKQELESRSGTIERFRVRNREVYAMVDKQTDEKPLFSNGFIEKQLRLPSTTRNLRTVRKLLDIAGDLD